MKCGAAMIFGRRMHEWLTRASLVAVPAAMACCSPYHDETVKATRAKYGPMIDACIADASKCDALCYQLTEDDGTQSMYEDFDIERCTITAQTADDATVSLTYYGGYTCGRRPRGLVVCGGAGRGAGAWLARVAALEAASVTAFARLVRQLARIGAPAWAIGGARAAILDEIVHARLVAQLARAAGARVEAPVVVGGDEATVGELALDNAIEGRIGETFGALIATCIARGAQDPRVRGAFARIAVDEARHAALAHRLAPWLAAQLDPPARARLAQAERAAIAGARLDGGLAPGDRAWLGLPDDGALAAAFGELRASIAAAA